jgi:hypothetical protein
MALFLSTIDDPIWESLTYRQDQMNSRSQTSWFMDKQPWVRMTSMAGIINKDNSIDNTTRLNWRLFGGIYGYDENTGKLTNSYANGFHQMYNMNKFYYNNDKLITTDPNAMINNPIPGITDVHIENKGDMGSVREATIKFVCWDLNQLDVLENLYMTPGVSVLLEWGWNKQITGENITDNLSEEKPMHDYCLVKKVTKKILDTKGHYGAIQGRIVNFGWSYKTNGGFDCTTTITSMAEAFLSADAHSKSQGLPSLGTKKNEDETTSEARIEENMMYYILQGLEILQKHKIMKDNNQNVVGIQVSGINGRENAFTRNVRSFVGTEVADDSSDWWNEDSVDNTDGASYFVTVEYFLHLINKSLSFIQTSYVDGCADSVIQKDINGKIIAPTFSKETVLINYIPNLISADPWVCIIPTPIFDGYGSDAQRILIERHYTSKLFSVVRNFNRNGIPDNRIELNKILINLKYVYECFKSTKNINDFVLKILNGISESCGGMWKFELLVNDETPQLISIIDTQTVVDDELPMPFVLTVGKVNSIVTDISFQSEVDNDMKLQAMYGSNKESESSENQTNISNVNDYLGFNFYGKTIINLAEGKIRSINANDEFADNSNTPSAIPLVKTEAINSQQVIYKQDASGNLIKNNNGVQNVGWNSTTLVNPTNINSDIKTIKITSHDIINDYSNAVQSCYSKRTPETARLAIASANKFVNELVFSPKTKKPYPQHSFPLMPLRLSITIDGICGLRNGNCIDISYKPTRYSNGRAYFQIVNVTHSIQGVNWFTTLETIMRVDLNKIVDNIDYSTGASARKPISSIVGVNAKKYNTAYDVDVINRNLTYLNEHIIAPLKAKFPGKIHVNRTTPKTLFSDTSQHDKGQAVDLEYSGDKSKNKEIFEFVRNNIKIFDQMIWEFGTPFKNKNEINANEYSDWVHISILSPEGEKMIGHKNRKEIRRAYSIGQRSGNHGSMIQPLPIINKFNA